MTGSEPRACCQQPHLLADLWTDRTCLPSCDAPRLSHCGNGLTVDLFGVWHAAGIDSKYWVICDGSNLSYYSPENLCRCLSMSSQVVGRPFRSGLAKGRVHRLAGGVIARPINCTGVRPKRRRTRTGLHSTPNREGMRCCPGKGRR